MSPPSPKTQNRWVRVPDGHLNLDHVVTLRLVEKHPGGHYEMRVQVRGEEEPRSYHWSWYLDAARAIGAAQDEVVERVAAARARQEELNREAAEAEKERREAAARRKTLEERIFARAQQDVAKVPPSELAAMPDQAVSSMKKRLWKELEAELSEWEKRHEQNAYWLYNGAFDRAWVTAEQAQEQPA